MNFIEHDVARSHFLADSIQSSLTIHSTPNVTSSSNNNIVGGNHIGGHEVHWSKAQVESGQWEEVGPAVEEEDVMKQYHFPQDYEAVRVRYYPFGKQQREHVDDGEDCSKERSSGGEGDNDSEALVHYERLNEDDPDICGEQSSSVYALREDAVSMIAYQQYSALAIAPGNMYAALGDSMGYVTLFSLHPFFLIVNRVATFASRRQAAEDAKQNSKMCDDDLRQKKKELLSLHKGVRSEQGSKGISKAGYASTGNSIEAVAFACDVSSIFVVTKFELEYISLSSNDDDGQFGRSIWRFDLLLNYASVPGKVMKIAMHPSESSSKGSILLGLHCFDERFVTASGKGRYQSLVCCNMGDGKAVEMKLLDEQNRQVLFGPKASVDWGQKVYDGRTYIYVSSCTAVNSLDEDPTRLIDKKHELLAIDSNSYKIVHRVCLDDDGWQGRALKATENVTVHPSGKHVLATSHRSGILMFNASNLAPISSFGEGFGIHGNFVQWQDCFFLDTTLPSSAGGCHTFVVGIPHAFREPKEMCDKLYLWDVAWYEKKLPTIRLEGPKEGVGIACMCYIDHDKADDTKVGKLSSYLLSIDINGQCYRLNETIRSNFPGVMFPPGYIAIENNIDYIEDEDEVDVDVGKDSSSFPLNPKECVPCNSNVEDFLDETIDILSASVEPVYLPCQPDFHLSSSFYLQASTNQTLGIVPSQQSKFFSHLPNVEDLIRKNQSIKRELMPEHTPANAPVKSRRTSVEALIKASIVPRIRNEMLQREEWSAGLGSIVKEDYLNQCLACKGRFVIHTCGMRVLPIDHDLEATKALERMEQEKELARQRRLEKNRERDRQRRAEKKRKKEEELLRLAGAETKADEWKFEVAETLNVKTNGVDVKPTSTRNAPTMFPSEISKTSTGDQIITLMPSRSISFNRNHTSVTSTKTEAKPIKKNLSQKGPLGLNSLMNTSNVNNIGQSRVDTNNIRVNQTEDKTCNRIDDKKFDPFDTQVGLRLEALAEMKAAKLDGDDRVQRIETAEEKREKILRTKRERERLRREAKKAEKKRREALGILGVSESKPLPSSNLGKKKVQSRPRSRAQSRPKTKPSNLPAVSAPAKTSAVPPVPEAPSCSPNINPNAGTGVSVQISKQVSKQEDTSMPLDTTACPVPPTSQIRSNGNHWNVEAVNPRSVSRPPLVGFPQFNGHLVPAMIPLMSSIAQNPYIFPAAGMLQFHGVPMNQQVAPVQQIFPNSNEVQNISSNPKPSIDVLPQQQFSSQPVDHCIESAPSVPPFTASNASTSDRDAAISMLELNATPYSDMIKGNKKPE